MPHPTQTEKVSQGQGFIAALDQSGGSTPKALRLYGIGEDAYGSDTEMFDLMHAMRARIIQSPAFSGDHIVGAILFEQTMDREVAGTPTGAYLWETCNVVPFLKVDKGLMEPEHGVKLMKPIPGLDDTLTRAVAKGMFGTKMRSVIDAADPVGIKAIVDQQFDIGAQIWAHGLVPILEPEVTISIPDKAEAEEMLKGEILAHLDALPDGQIVMLKLTLPAVANTYAALIDHPRVLKVVALSGGYSRDEANDKLAGNRGMIASFSRALTEGLSAQQSDADFDAMLGQAVKSIHAASIAG
ncbi:MAG: fructose bisphosphate aldolase [Pseudomonadota bacterium]